MVLLLDKRMKISICIAAYEMRGMGSHFILECLESINKQTLLPYEVIISDQSNDTSVADAISSFVPNEYSIIYHHHPGRGLSSNFNNAIGLASGDVIKLMCQDDFFHDTNSLLVETKYLGAHKWALTSTVHLKWDKAKISEYYWHLIPSYRPDIYLGRNSIGSPSLFIGKRESMELFDEELSMLADCDFYWRMIQKFGFPPVSPIPTVVSRKWDGQEQNHIDSKMIDEEVQIVISKYRK